MTDQLTIRDVTPRDGLQAERPLPPATRAGLCRRLQEAGLRKVEVASFVSPQRVPSMAGAADVFAALPRVSDAAWWALVPNAKGAQLATAAGAAHLTVTVSASEAYSLKNIGKSTKDSIAALAAVVDAAGDATVDVVVSCCFGSPFDDVADARTVGRALASVMSRAPDALLTLADTTGTATPRRIRAVLDEVPAERRSSVGLHLHDTRGTALANAMAALEMGVLRFDTAVGGLGGSPFAPGAGGDLATEDFVLMLEDEGYDTGVDLDILFAIGRELSQLIEHGLPSRVSAAGALVPFGA